MFNFVFTLLALSIIAQYAYAGGSLKNPVKDICYIEICADHDLRKLDLYPAPKKKTKSPALIWFHGGGLTSGTKDYKTDQNFARFWQANGVTVINVNYRLSPSVKFPAYIEDSARAVAWVFSHAKEHGIDEQKIFIGGHSAGAYITTMLALAPGFLAPHDIDPHRLAGYVSLSGQMTTHFTVRKERGLSDLPVIVDEAAPAYYVQNSPPPILFLIGDNDWPARLEENQLIYAHFSQLAKTKNVDFQIIQNRTHGSIYEKIIEPNDETFNAIERFMRKNMGN